MTQGMPAPYTLSGARIRAGRGGAQRRMPERILITGGAGFVGSNLALAFKRDRPSASVVAFDNLRRRGSELTLERLRAGGVEFVHGDVRSPDDLAGLGPATLLVEASA